MITMFDSIEDKNELDKLLVELRAAYRNTIAARDLAKAIITRKIKQPEFVRSVQRHLFPQFQQMVLELRELIVEAKERRKDVQGTV